MMKKKKEERGGRGRVGGQERIEENREYELCLYRASQNNVV